MRCRICKAGAQNGDICNSCLDVRGTIANGISYGHYIADGMAAERDKYRDIKKLRKGEKICKQCGTVFIPNAKTVIFCSRECAAEARRAPMKICAFCGNKFWPKSIEICCSVSCTLAYREAKLREEIDTYSLLARN